MTSEKYFELKPQAGRDFYINGENETINFF